MHVLVAEDDLELNRQLTLALQNVGYSVESATDGEQAYRLGDAGKFDAAVLDIGLPGMDGIEVLRKWRGDGQKMAVLILTAREHWSDKVTGIDAGADDYLAKPFFLPELIARLRAVIRRSSTPTSIYRTSGDMQFDTRTGDVVRGGVSLSLTAFERRVLHYLLRNTDRAVDQAELITHLYAQHFERDSNTVSVFIRRLRSKLGPDVIETVRGEGYRLRLDESPETD